MCGIAGILSFEANASIIKSDLIERMRDTMVHRGPDDAGVYRDEFIALGQRRLSIIDLAGGMQPMSDSDGQIWVLNNGEIYNYREIRQELEPRGCVFHTESDTEAIVQGYCVYGEDVVKHLRGMFAAAVWDAREKCLLLARDRVGKKPLYYALVPEGLLFASELKALLEYENLPRDLDYTALSDFFTYQSIPEPLTIFKHVRKLPPGHYLTCDVHGNLEVKRYWRWSLIENQQKAINYDDAVFRVRELIEESVRLRMIADVPLGALLSGGVDSSAVVAMMARHASGAVRTFSIGFSSVDYDERPFAREVAEFCGTEHEELLVEPENIREILPRLAHQYDEPFADSSALPTYYVCKMARQHVTVALAGDGGDEGFAGYFRFQKFMNISRQFDRIPFVRIPGSIAAALMPAGMRGRRTIRLLSEPIATRYQRMSSLFDRREIKSLLVDSTFSGRMLINDRVREWTAAGLPVLSQLQAADLEIYLPSTVLVKVDRASMLNSLEVRAPLLDHHLLDFVGTLPAEWQPGKRILKDAIRGLVPDRVLNRPKAGFSVPLEHWFNGDFGDFLREILLDDMTRRRGFLNVAYVERLINRQDTRWAELTLQLWAVLMFELWCREYDIYAA